MKLKSIYLTSLLGLALLNVFSSNSVQHSTTLRWENTRVKLEIVSFLIFLDEFELLQLLETPPDDLGWGVIVELRSNFSSVETTIEVREQSDSWVGAKIDFTSKWSDSCVDPVVI